MANREFAPHKLRRRRTLPDPESESLVRSIFEVLDATEAGDDSTAGDAAHHMRVQLEQISPGLDAQLGDPPAISLRDVLLSGRDVYDIVYDWIALRVTIGTDEAGRGVPLSCDIDGRWQFEKS